MYVLGQDGKRMYSNTRARGSVMKRANNGRDITSHE
jgi:hypothetical protein